MSAKTMPPSNWLPQSRPVIQTCRWTRAFAGRVNIHAAEAGVLALDVAQPSTPSTASTKRLPWQPCRLLPRWCRDRWQPPSRSSPMPCRRPLLSQALARIAAAKQPLLRLHPYRPHRIALIQTELPGIKASVLDKTERVMAERLALMGQAAPIASRCPHHTEVLQGAIAAGAQRRRRDGTGHRRLGHQRPARCHSGRDHRARWRGRSFRHAGRSRQPAAARPYRQPCRS